MPKTISQIKTEIYAMSRDELLYFKRKLENSCAPVLEGMLEGHAEFEKYKKRVLKIVNQKLKVTK